VREAAILDLIAIDPARPDAWRLVRGSVTVLGGIEPQYLNPAPVPIRPDPRDWLRADGEGLCLLSHDPCEQRQILNLCRGGYVVDDPAFGARLRDLVARPLIEPPPVYVAQRAAA
jgi:hypothetical protein